MNSDTVIGPIARQVYLGKRNKQQQQIQNASISATAEPRRPGRHSS